MTEKNTGLLELAARESAQPPNSVHKTLLVDSPLGNKDCRNDPTKLRFDLITPEMEEALARVLTYGAGRYGSRNWEKGIPSSELYAATRRHLFSWLQGEAIDESSLPHLWHAFCNIGMLLTMDQRRPDLDDLHRKT